jgi:hypothetical protein
VETEVEDLASPDAVEDVDNEETVENVRSGDGHDEMAGVGETDGDGEESRTGGALELNSAGSSISTSIRHGCLGSYEDCSRSVSSIEWLF